MPGSINGTGTMWYGRALPRDDGSVVVTEWITLVWLPLLPLGSKRIKKAAEDPVPWWKYKSLGENFETIPVPLHIPHVIKGYAATTCVVVVLGLGFLSGA